jgi:tetratricopeptide (TPR) repeat protein
LAKQEIKAVMLAGLLLVLSLTVLVSASPESDFQKANELYENRDFKEAIELYTAIMDQGLESSSLYFNLGNAYFKSGDLGHATLFYLRASRLAPADDDIRDNLEFARGFTSIQMEGVELNPIRSFLETLLEPYSIESLAWASSVLFVTLFFLLILRFGIGWQYSAIRVGIASILVLTAVSLFVTTFRFRYEYLTRRAVLIAEDCSVRTGPSAQSEIELEGAPGLVVEILSESGDYYNVLFENKRRGWILKELVAVV